MTRARLVPATLATLVAACVAACASTRPPTSQLVEARRAYGEALASDAPALAQKPLADAQRALNDAELVHREAPGSAHEQHLAYLATRRAQLAIAVAGVAAATREREAARVAYAAALERHDTETAEQRDALARQNQELAATSAELAPALARKDAELAAEREARAKLEHERDEALAKVEQFAGVQETSRGTVITLGGALLFRSGSATLIPSARAKLDQVAAALLNVDTDQNLVIEGHADARGPGKLNRELSAARAEAVRVYLVERGVPRAKLVALGRGEDQPRAANDTAEGRATNRRVEIVITRPQAATGPTTAPPP